MSRTARARRRDGVADACNDAHQTASPSSLPLHEYACSGCKPTRAAANVSVAAAGAAAGVATGVAVSAAPVAAAGAAAGVAVGVVESI